MTCECVRCAQAEAIDHAVDQVIERFAECTVYVDGELTAALLPSPDGEWVRYEALAAAQQHVAELETTLTDARARLEQRVAELKAKVAYVLDLIQ